METHIVMRQEGEDTFYIELTEDYPCENVEQLHKREGELIRESAASLNKQIAGRTRQEWIEENRGKVKIQRKSYYTNKEEVIKNTTTEYKEKHKDWFNQYYKEYYENNKEHLKEKTAIKGMKRKGKTQLSY